MSKSSLAAPPNSPSGNPRIPLLPGDSEACINARFALSLQTLTWALYYAGAGSGGEIVPVSGLLDVLSLLVSRLRGERGARARAVAVVQGPRGSPTGLALVARPLPSGGVEVRLCGLRGGVAEPIGLADLSRYWPREGALAAVTLV